GDTTITARDAWKIELIPKEGAPVVWGRILIYVSKEDNIELLIKYYDEDDFLINTMILSDIRELGGRVIPARMDMIPAENPKNRTVIQYHDIEFDIGISEDFFSIQKMKRIR
ncbi:MAG: outer membrane lipoprotein-sorting protein, partial [Flavobacteriaceae bacterium]